MAEAFSRSFRIRYYECDANGHLNNANYLRFMQEAATDASANIGYDEQRYRELNRIWLPFTTEIEYFRPAVFGDSLQVKTWVADFRRASSRRMYAFTRVSDGVPIALAHTDWMFLNSQTGRPVSIPSEIVAAYLPEGLPEDVTERKPFPQAQPAPPGAYEWQRRVEFRDIDVMQHVNNAVYLEYAGECGAQHVTSVGWPWERMKSAGFAIYLRRNHIQYKQAAVLRDGLLIRTWLYQVRRSTAMRVYQICRAQDGALLAEVHAMGVCVDLVTGAPMRWPETLMADLAPSIAAG